MTGDGSNLVRDEDRPPDRQRVAALERELEQTRERLQLEQLKLEQTEAALWQMSVLFGNIPVPVLLMDADGTVTDVNHEAERVFEGRRDGLLGRPLATLVPADRRDRCEEVLRRCRGGDLVRGVERLLWGDEGQRRAAMSTLYPIRDPHGLVVGMALAEDIEEIKAQEELLRSVNQQLQQLANRDPLTGLANRREYERTLDREVGRAVRHGRLLSLVMIDVDDFKAFNDCLGHAAGDRCLVRVAHALSACLKRPGDFVARYGGEEFVALLPGTGPGGGRLISERMRAAVEREQLEHPESSTAPFVTVSVGVASVRVVPGFDGRALQEAADRALYSAKRGGRNRVAAVDLAPPVRPLESGAHRHATHEE